MKIYRNSKICWKMMGVICFMTLLIGCRSTAQKPEPAPSQPSAAPSEPAPAPAKPSPATGRPATPSKEATPPPKDVAALPPEKSLPEEKYFTHTVKWSGETVSIIAAWYTGDIENWKILGEVMLKHNPNADIKRIFVGNKILIPESMLKTRDPMPKDFVDSFYKKSKPDKAPPKTTPAETEEEPKLFGPRESPKK